MYIYLNGYKQMTSVEVSQLYSNTLNCLTVCKRLFRINRNIRVSNPWNHLTVREKSDQAHLKMLSTKCVYIYI